MSDSSRTYLSATGRDWLLPLYDPLVKLLGGAGALERLLDQAELRSGHRVLKEKTLRAMRRVLRPGGSLHLLDFEGPEDAADSFLARLPHVGR